MRPVLLWCREGAPSHGIPYSNTAAILIGNAPWCVLQPYTESVVSIYGDCCKTVATVYRESVAALSVCCKYMWSLLQPYMESLQLYTVSLLQPSLSVAAVYEVCCNHIQSLLQPYTESVAAVKRICTDSVAAIKRVTIT